MRKADPVPPEDASGAALIELWRGMAARTLAGRPIESLTSRSRDGIPIEPLYAARRDVAALPGRGGRAWIVVQNLDEPDPQRVNERALAAIEGGATGLALHFAPSGLPATLAALREALDGIDLAAIHLRIEPAAHGLELADLVRESVVASGLAPERSKIAFGLDPLAGAAESVPDLARFAAMFQKLRAARFGGPLAILDGRPFHAAGATEAQELAVILGAAAWWLRALEASGVAPEAALPLIGASLSVDQDVLLSIAKLRALRLLWSRLQDVCGAPRNQLQVHAETSQRMLSRDDVLDNLLRNTLAAFSAGVGGADSVSVVEHTAPLGVADRNGRALARNIQHLLMEESDLHRVADPAAGSGAVEALTDRLAERAWEEFRAIEREGGILESLRGGLLRKRINAVGAGLEAAQ
jgi:methylmalonyl-CoA mutase